MMPYRSFAIHRGEKYVRVPVSIFLVLFDRPSGLASGITGQQQRGAVHVEAGVLG